MLRHFQHTQEQSDGKKSVLVFEQGIQYALKQAIKNDYEEDALILAKAARIAHEDIFSSNGFDATFPSDCLQKSVPTSLKSLVAMLMRGADLKDQESTDSHACLTASQVILFNCKKNDAGKKQPSNVKSQH